LDSRSLIALVVDSSLARSALHVYGIAQLPCSAYELSLHIDIWDGMLTHVYSNWLDSTVMMEEWAEREEPKRNVNKFCNCLLWVMILYSL